MHSPTRQHPTGVNVSLAAQDSPGSGSIFDRSLGPHDDCFSPRQLIRLMFAGLNDDEMKHLESCPSCREAIVGIGGVSLESDPDFVRNAMRAANMEKPTIITDRAAVLSRPERPLPAIIGLRPHVVSIEDPSVTNLNLSCLLFPGFSPLLLKKVIPESLRIRGAIVANGGRIVTCDLNDDKKDDIAKISFTCASLGKLAKKGITEHFRFVDTITVTGNVGDQEFLGQAEVELDATNP